MNALASGDEITVSSWIEAGIASREIASARGVLQIKRSVPELPPTVMTVVGFGDTAANVEFIERLLIDHASPGKTYVRYREGSRGENKLVRTAGNQREVLASYVGFDFDREDDRVVLLDILELVD